MTKYLLAFVAVVGLGMGSIACGGNACEDNAQTAADKIASCISTPGTSTSTSSSASTTVECTAEREAASKKLADCYSAAECKAIDGSDTPAATKLQECLTK